MAYKYAEAARRLQLHAKFQEKIFNTTEKLLCGLTSTEYGADSTNSVSLEEIKHISDNFGKDFIDQHTLIITTYSIYARMKNYCDEINVNNFTDRQLLTGQVYNFCGIQVKTYASDTLAKIAALVSKEYGFKPILVLE